MASRLYGQESDRLKKRLKERQVGENTSRRERFVFLFTKSTQNNKLSNQGFPSLRVCVCACVCVCVHLLVSLKYHLTSIYLPECLSKSCLMMCMRVFCWDCLQVMSPLCTCVCISVSVHACPGASSLYCLFCMGVELKAFWNDNLELWMVVYPREGKWESKRETQRKEEEGGQ